MGATGRAGSSTRDALASRKTCSARSVTTTARAPSPCQAVNEPTGRSGCGARVVVEPQRLVHVDPELVEGLAELGVGLLEAVAVAHHAEHLGDDRVQRQRPAVVGLERRALGPGPLRPELRGVDGGDADGRRERAARRTSPTTRRTPRSPPGQPAVGRGGVGEHAALAGLHQRQHGLEGHRRVVRRPAGGVEDLGDQRPPVRHRDLEPGAASHVIGSSRSPRSSSSRASASSCGSTMRRSTPVVGHHGRGLLSQPAASAPSTKWRSAGERRDVPAAASEGRLQPLDADQRPGLGDLVAGRRSRPRSDVDERRPQRVRRRPPSCRGRRPAGAARARSPSVSRTVGQVSRGRRPTSGRPMSPCATRSAHRTARSSSTEACTAATTSSSPELGRVEAGQQRHPEHQLALGQLELGPRHQPDHVGPGHPALRVDDAAQGVGLLLAQQQARAGPSARPEPGQVVAGRRQQHRPDDDVDRPDGGGDQQQREARRRPAAPSSRAQRPTPR